MATLKRVEYYLSEITLNIATILLIIVTILVFSPTVLRIFGINIRWASEVSIYSFVTMTFWGCAKVSKLNGHIKVDLFYKYIPKRMKRYYDGFLHLCEVAFFFLVAYGLRTFMKSSSTMFFISLDMIPINIFYGANLIGLLLSGLSSFFSAIIVTYDKKEEA